MKTFEVYKIAEDGARTLLASSQADYFESSFGTVKFFRKRFFIEDALIAQAYLPNAQTIIADTEFFLDLPADPTRNAPDEPKAYSGTLPTPKRRPRKNDLLNLS